ncbi:uncharacterized protein LOC133312554 isoform X2 [Gastrolobium bilobum]|uniref:uncharacterized protein LOC133312554 isoform X2 n=1 Tax=Gastrolobium bilobum TaxID=150636 RepID=UPI002AB0F622|nr:uncharacterized protein LOC133312554 isoform X2 [Gastrolobium bilobum]
MAEQKDAFFVVTKGDVVGIYKSFSDIQPLLSSSKTQEYLDSHGLKGASYSLSAADVHEGLFGRIDACPYQHPSSSQRRAFDGNSSSKSLQRAIQSDNSLSCILEFDGASKGNPGPSGAGAVLRAEDGSKVYRLREGVGHQTNNVAEYRALILGLRHAIKKGYKHIRVQGDSLLVCNQIQGLWKIKNQNMAYLCNEAKELKARFLSFKINHVLREYNSEADVQANLAINLKAGQVEEDCQLL